MPRISDIIFCANAQSNNGEGVSVNNILTAINPEYVPGLFSFSVVVTILDIDCTQTHPIRIEFLDPSNELVLEIEGVSPIVEENSNLPAEHKGLNLTMNWNNVNFKSSGEYTIKIHIDGNLIQDKKIFVKGKNE